MDFYLIVIDTQRCINTRSLYWVIIIHSLLIFNYNGDVNCFIGFLRISAMNIFQRKTKKIRILYIGNAIKLNQI